MYTCPNRNNNRPNNGKHQNSSGGKHVKFQKGILKNKKTSKAFAQVSQGKRNKSPRKNKHNGMGFVQLAKIEKLSADEIKKSIDDEPNNNIVEITGVHHVASED